MRTEWKTWGEAFQAYRNSGNAIDIAAMKADEWERRKKKNKEQYSRGVAVGEEAPPENQ